jgi:hypothetical protein
MLPCGRERFHLNRLIHLDKLFPERRQSRTAAAESARGGFDHGKTKRIVQVIDKQPGATVGKPKISPSLYDRCGLMNLLKQMNFTRSNRAPAGQIDPQRQSRLFYKPLLIAAQKSVLEPNAYGALRDAYIAARSTPG